MSWPSPARKRTPLRPRWRPDAMNIALPALARTQPSPFLATLWRYSLSVAGPVAVSGAHFLASLLFLRNLSAAEFGIFSFVLVAGSFAMSVSGAGLVLPA